MESLTTCETLQVLWRGLNFHVIRNSSESWRISDDKLEIKGLTGSIWGTSTLRREVFGTDEQPVKNIFLSELAKSVSTSVVFVPKAHGAQAGVLLYSDDTCYVKLVVEGNKVGHTMIIFAVQYNSHPEVISKLQDFPNDGCPISLQLSLTSTGLSATVNGNILEINQQSDVLTSIACAPGLRAAIMAHSFELEKDWASFESFTFTPA